MQKNIGYTLNEIEDYYGFIKDDYEPPDLLLEDENSRYFLLKENLSVTLRFRSQSYQGIGEAKLGKFSNGTKVSLFGVFENIKRSGEIWDSSLKNDIHFYHNGKEILGIFSGCWDLSDGKVKVGWSPINSYLTSGLDVLGNDNTRIQKAIFHLFNFPILTSTPLKQQNVDDLSTTIPSLNLSFDKWSINLIFTGKTEEPHAGLSKSDTFYLTHVGVIEKTDGEKFKAQELMNLLIRMNLFFSFLKGGVCTISCPIGYDEYKSVVWELLHADRRLSQNINSWYSLHYQDYIQSFFSSFMKKLRTSEWENTMTEVISWYGTINSFGLDQRAQIILLQTALERLSYELVVVAKKLMQKEGYQKLPAADKLRVLFSSLKIPLEIPSYATNLIQLKKSENWSDMPQAITEIRNSIVHPEHKKRGKHHAAAIIEANELSISYLELCILAICDYNGKYEDRLVTFTQPFADKKVVPWVTDIQES